MPLCLNILQDAAKVFTFYILKRYNIFGYNDTGMIDSHVVPPGGPNHHQAAQHGSRSLDCGGLLSAAASSISSATGGHVKVRAE